jgi:hypothetical protein
MKLYCKLFEHSISPLLKNIGDTCYLGTTISFEVLPFDNVSRIEQIQNWLVNCNQAPMKMEQHRCFITVIGKDIRRCYLNAVSPGDNF